MRGEGRACLAERCQSKCLWPAYTGPTAGVARIDGRGWGGGVRRAGSIDNPRDQAGSTIEGGGGGGLHPH